MLFRVSELFVLQGNLACRGGLELVHIASSGHRNGKKNTRWAFTELVSAMWDEREIYFFVLLRTCM
jgi:hypothetical protein